MPLHADTRLEKAAASSERWAAAARNHRAKEAKARAKGRIRSADMAKNAAEEAERHARNHARDADALTVPAARARVARRVNEDSAEAILDRAITAAAVTPHPEALDPKEERRLAREAEKRERQERQAEATRQAQARKAGITHDPRTAAAQREVVVSTRRGAEAVASFADYASLIRSRSERTIERVKAMEVFDDLCHRSLAGLLPEPKFERGVDVSKGIPGVADDRASSLQEMQRLTARIGVEAQALLYFRVFERRTFAWMEADGHGDAELLGALFLRGLDAVAAFYGITRPPRAVEALEEQLQQVGS